MKPWVHHLIASCQSTSRVRRFFSWSRRLFRNYGSRICRVFAIRRVLTYWLHTVAELIVSAINNLKTMGRERRLQSPVGLPLFKSMTSVLPCKKGLFRMHSHSDMVGCLFILPQHVPVVTASPWSTSYPVQSEGFPPLDIMRLET